MTPSSKPVGDNEPTTRDALLNAVEQVILDNGYARVTHRAIAREAGVTPCLVPYYFPTVDSIFVAALRRRTDRNIERLNRALQARPDELLHVMWEFSWEEGTGHDGRVHGPWLSA